MDEIIILKGTRFPAIAILNQLLCCLLDKDSTQL